MFRFRYGETVLALVDPWVSADAQPLHARQADDERRHRRAIRRVSRWARSDEGLGDLLGGYLLGTDPTDIDRVQDLLKQAGLSRLAQLLARGGVLGHQRQSRGEARVRADRCGHVTAASGVPVHRRGASTRAARRRAAAHDGAWLPNR